MDILNDILETLDFQGVLYFRTDFSSPWGLTVPRHQHAARFHLVIQGQCIVTLPAGDSVALNSGDLVLIPHGQTHCLSDQPQADAPPLETVLENAAYNGEGVLTLGNGNPQASTQMVCGHFNFRNDADHPILRTLPDYLVISAIDRARQPWLDEILRLIVRRVFTDDIGNAAIIKRLSETLFIELLRNCVSHQNELGKALSGFSDKHIGKALVLIHMRPENTWTVAELANRVGMSRSRFSDRFSDLVGIAPMGYLIQWRLQKSLSLLHDGQSSIKTIAARVGYQSPAAFSRAFAEKFGVSPNKYIQRN